MMKSISIRRTCISLLLTMVLLLSACSSTGSGLLGDLLAGNSKLASEVVISTEHFTVNGAMMSYFFHAQFNSYYQYYYQMWSYYFQSAYNSPYELMGIDTSKSLKDQYMSGENPISMFDYYMELTEDYVTRMLTYCESAVQSGISLTDEDQAKIDQTIDDLKETFETEKEMYESFGYSYYINFPAYLAANYGDGVRQEDVRQCLELITLASKYEEALSLNIENEILSDASNAAVEQYVADNPVQFLMADYYSYTISVTNQFYTDAEFENEKALLLEKAKEITQDASSYRDGVLSCIEDEEFNEYLGKEWVNFFNAYGGDVQKAGEAIKKEFAKTVWTEDVQNVKYAGTLKTEYRYPSAPTDQSQWIFQAKAGDVAYFESTTQREEAVQTDSGIEKVKVTTYSITLCLLEKEAYRNTEMARNFGYVMFSAKQQAERFYEEYKKGTMNMATMLDVLQNMQGQIPVYGYDVREDYLLGDLEDQNVYGADEWLEKAKPGSCSGIVELKVVTSTTNDYIHYDETTTIYYAILVYDGENYEYWYTQALRGVHSEKIEDWYAQNRIELSFDRAVYDLIDGGYYIQPTLGSNVKPAGTMDFTVTWLPGT